MIYLLSGVLVFVLIILWIIERDRRKAWICIENTIELLPKQQGEKAVGFWHEEGENE